MQHEIILASSSTYRANALRALGVTFQSFDPRVDEAARLDESPEQLSVRLAEAKCRAGLAKYASAYIIGSDQVGWVNGEILTKPGGFDQALAQLRRCQGQQATFYTALTFYRPDRQHGSDQPASFREPPRGVHVRYWLRGLRSA